MKKYVALALAFVLAVCAAGCAADAPESPAIGSEIPDNTEAGHSQVLISYNGAGTGQFYLTVEEAQVLENLIEHDGWAENCTDYTQDVVISLRGQLLGYYSGTGTFTNSATRSSLTLSEEDRLTANGIFARYMTLGITHVSPPAPEYDWGVTLTLENLTRSGATIVSTQSGGEFTGELNTGSFFILEQLTENGWQEVVRRDSDGYLVWTTEAYVVNLNGTTRWELNWEWLYGELPDGHYRLGKELMNFRGPGDYDIMMVYTEFSFGEMPIGE